MQHRIVLPRGDTALVSFEIEGRNPQVNDRAVMAIRRAGGGLVLEMVSTVEQGKPVQFLLTHDDTERMREGDYEWDVRYVTNAILDAEGRVTGGEEVATFYQASPLEITKVVTKL